MTHPLVWTAGLCALLCAGAVYVAAFRHGRQCARRPHPLRRLYRVIPEGPPRGVRYLPTRSEG